MQLIDLLAQVPGIEALPDHSALSAEVKGLTTNSLVCQPGDLFIGMPGTRVDGGDFWQSAIASGAIAAIVSPQAAAKAISDPAFKSQTPLVISATDMTQACAAIAAAFYDFPASKLKLVGVTGTNGKTTTTHLIEFLLEKGQQPAALFGTLYTRWQGFQQIALHTTPFAIDLQRQFAAAIAAGCQVGVMEVSSHALAQGRVRGCPFEVSVFTNLTQDHLDFHKDMDDYFAAKALLFSADYLKGRAVINLDDPYGQRLIEQSVQQVWSYSTQQPADLWMSDLTYGADGVSGMLHTPQGDMSFRSPLVGQFNLENLLAAIAVGLHLELDLELMVNALPKFKGVPGRMEQVHINSRQDISVIVDYAHTPDSLENMLKAARPFIAGQMICVFGCGGDRDRTKRPLMGNIAATLADRVIVTSDNPRTEDPVRILEDVVAGIPASVQPIVLSDRATAIRTAILQANPGDGVLIAGKGHEDYQILGTEKIHFDDREQARSALTKRVAPD
ncbi:UDP-N-acetylmuramoyl-L-alanyl-D-glutamate--2,6-diaminopimelate ligase [Phormidesmis priestleyi ULC007]|uniref:UDP-N-acetylmuramoyl-L-alanyl-D-glutamate--2,6-diaminopimelate ligase n=1 Tax=Phormidesmis priestleyi ULC007 TaxID=1920490 RepID=A0A2T1D8S7_9CYAN|nr:UDP-N-acetylmuramoyl-L-alanyl-D-glutamate--2,6-diaminopimelate ligase [Phormidesmis priestleyi]PSB16844.1 UDP-N-acetylmuramoyl-L-alanyl-D-glutamate--2,6-diaminopimelate ligase [Phormidesmis priestleyi ULC007]PZO47759.1 MAG: UDP-N-acetylmuramoyl-L-alanyl-D-glutamate--2,6-diaminopimelate ligase [Phormidesmis priestleyi]